MGGTKEDPHSSEVRCSHSIDPIWVDCFSWKLEEVEMMPAV